MSCAAAFQECALNTRGFSVTNTEIQTRNGFLKSTRRGKTVCGLGRLMAGFGGAEGKVAVGFLLFISSVVLEIGN